MAFFEVNGLAVGKDSIFFQTDRKIVDFSLLITRSYFKNNVFDVTDILKLVNKDKCHKYDNSKSIKGIIMKIIFWIFI